MMRKFDFLSSVFSLVSLIQAANAFQHFSTLTSLTSIRLHPHRQHVQQYSPLMMTDSSSNDDWIDLVEGYDAGASPVRKIILEEGSGDTPSPGANVAIEYVGTIGKSQAAWSVNDVVECWLKNQQGLYDVLAEPFKENGVDGKMLFDDSVFEESYISNTLGVSNKIQCKKTVMAAKRLRSQAQEFSEGMEFDSSISRGKPFEFILGKGKAIKAMDLLVSTMKLGEKARMTCRSDFAYSAEGYRKSNGEVMIPPFADLCFEITLVSVK